MDVKKIRNFGIMAHIDAGKTTITERILFQTDKIHKIGETHDGESQMDWMEQEQKRGITITSAATIVEWKGIVCNLIDTPGHVDFTAEVERSLRVLDGAITVLDANAGVEPQTVTVWKHAERRGNLPRIFFINKMDKIGASVKKSLQTIKTILNANAHPIQLPIGTENDFRGIINLLTMEAFIFDGKEGEDYQKIVIPESLVTEAQLYRKHLIEAVGEFSDSILEKYFMHQEITAAELKEAVAQATKTTNFFPVLWGSALRNKGIKFLLDSVIDYLPSPLNTIIEGINNAKVVIRLKPSAEETLSALVFKIMTDSFVGRLSFVRVYSGVLRAKSYVYNSTNKKKERVSRLLLMHANNRTDTDKIEAGGIGAIVGLKNTTTGNTLCEKKNLILLEKIIFSEPVISQALEPKTKADQEKMSISLKKLMEEDPTFRTFSDHETGQTIISGMGELHLEVLVERLRSEFLVNTNVGRPQVAYRETFTANVVARGQYIKQSGGRGMYGDVEIRYEPNPSKGFIFESKIVGGRVPKEYFPAIKKGIEEAMKGGVLAGYPIHDLKAILVDGTFHDVDSSEMSFKIAASKSLKQAAKTGGKPVLLEPIMAAELSIPKKYYGDIIGDISSRRAKIHGTTTEGNTQILEVNVPLVEMFGYTTDLRSLTQGMGSHTMEFKEYLIVPRDIAEKIIMNKK